MTRRDYIALADALKAKAAKLHLDNATPATRMGFEQAVHAVADALAADNPRFDRDRFLTAALFTR